MYAQKITHIEANRLRSELQIDIILLRGEKDKPSDKRRDDERVSCALSNGVKSQHRHGMKSQH